MRLPVLAISGRALATRSRRGKAYVDAFIRAAYLPTEAEALAWVASHKDKYEPRHVLAIISNGLGASLKKKASQKLLKDVEAALMA